MADMCVPYVAFDSRQKKKKSPVTKTRADETFKIGNEPGNAYVPGQLDSFLVCLSFASNLATWVQTDDSIKKVARRCLVAWFNHFWLSSLCFHLLCSFEMRLDLPLCWGKGNQVQGSSFPFER